MPPEVSLLSVVVPLFNEQGSVAELVRRLTAVLEVQGTSFEIVFVDDGSRDDTVAHVLAARREDERVRLVRLARNFGKDIALSAGLAHASGDIVITMDGDLQHPPELIPELLGRAAEDDVPMVIAVRASRDEESLLRKTAARSFYRLFKLLGHLELPPGAGDFRLLRRQIVDVLNAMPERSRFMKGLFTWPGFAYGTVTFEVPQRAKGKSGWSFFKLFRFALDGLLSFSTTPLRISTYAGVATALAAFLYMAQTIVKTVLFGIDVPGYASLLSLLLFFHGLALISNGIQGEYIARIFDEVKGRPLWVVLQSYGCQVVPRPARLTATSASIERVQRPWP